MNSASRGGYALGGVGFVLVFLLARACAPEWTVNPQYGYGWLIPFLVLYLGMKRLSSNICEVAVPKLSSATVAIVGGLMALALGVDWVRMQHPPMRVMMGIQGAIWALFVLFGWRDYTPQFRSAVTVPFLLLLTSVPWPTRVEEPLTRALMSWVTGGAMELLHLIGVIAHREGELIIFPNAIVGVSEACSGIRSLQAAFVFSLILGEWRRGGIRQRAELLLIGLILALSGNLLRTLALCGIASNSGMEQMEYWHDTSGNLLLLFLIGGLVGWSLWRIPQAKGGEEVHSVSFHQIKHQSSKSMRVILMIAIVLAIGINLHAYFQRSNEGVNSEPVIEWRKSTGDRSLSIPSEVWRNLRASSGEWIERKIEGFEAGKMEFYHFYWKPIRDSQGVRLHRPDWCMQGLGWKRIGAPVQGEILIQGGKLEGYWIQYRKPGGEAVQFWTLLRNQSRVEIDFQAPALVEDVHWRTFLFPQEQSSTWEMISIVVSSPWMVPEQRQVEELAIERIQKNKPKNSN